MTGALTTPCPARNPKLAPRAPEFLDNEPRGARPALRLVVVVQQELLGMIGGLRDALLVSGDVGRI